MKRAFPAVIDVRYDRRVSRIVLSLASGLPLHFAPRDVPGLQHARPAELANAQLSPSCLGVHFPHIDTDVYLPALLDSFL
ncbi:DUF2442 domain-containing protein [Pseudoduganella ginsengisoli]|nr:DUF2442 domain-containing protein [Pseudoduganella ginsengisoli]